MTSPARPADDAWVALAVEAGAPDEPTAGERCASWREQVDAADRDGMAFRRLEHDPPPWLVAVLREHGVVPVREVVQLRCPLPRPDPWSLDVRAFRPGSRDEQDWLDVNNRAFAWHPDQAGRTLDDLHADMRQPWFDAEGFLVHERSGRFAGSCWLKIHPAAPPDPAMGEVYVISVDPDLHGLGIGRELTLAGLAWLANRGLDVGMLYAESDNHVALHLYGQLGFVEHHRDVWFAYDPTTSTPVA